MLIIDSLKKYQSIEVFAGKPVSVIALPSSDIDTASIINILEYFKYKPYHTNKYYSENLTPINQLIKEHLISKMEKADIYDIDKIISYFNFSIRKVICKAIKEKKLKHADIVKATSIKASEISAYSDGTKNILYPKLDIIIAYLGLKFYHKSDFVGQNIREAINNALQKSTTYHQASIAKEIGVSKQNFSGFLKAVPVGSGAPKSISYDKLEKCILKLEIEIK